MHAQEINHEERKMSILRNVQGWNPEGAISARSANRLLSDDLAVLSIFLDNFQ